MTKSHTPPETQAAAQQQLFVVQSGLFKDATAWISNKGDNINKPPSVDFRAAQSASGSMVVSNALDQPYGGALVSYTQPPPIVEGNLLPYIAYRLACKFSEATYYNLARHEIDLKVCYKTRPNSSTKIPNVANFSTQWNLSTGQYQIDTDPPKWIDTGFIIDPRGVDPRIWHTLEFRFFFDPVGLTFSVLSIRFDAQAFNVPLNLQNVPMQVTNWEQCAKLQIQNEGFQPGAVVIDYDQGVMVWSNQPIEVIPS